MFTKEVIELAKPCVEAIKKISKAKGKEWKWKPEVGEWCLWKKHPHLVLEPEGQDNWFTIYVDKDEAYYHRLVVPLKRCIPLLHWEKLEGILEDLGYFLEVEKIGCEDCECLILKGTGDPDTECIAVGRGKTRQEAVMRAIIKLGEEIGK